MMKKTLLMMVGLLMAGAASADFDVLYSGHSASVSINLQSEPVVDDCRISWDAQWVGGNENATVVISDNGTEIRRATGAGEFAHSFSDIGRHDLKYTTYIGGVVQDEIYAVTVFKDWKYKLTNDGAIIIGTAHTDGDVTIPSVIDGHPVTGIAGGAFAGCTGLTSITIPTSVTRIDNGAFAGCTSLTQRVVLDQQGGSGGAHSVTATYYSEMPSITVPTRPGYTFRGYWTNKDGTGMQYYNSSGVGTCAWEEIALTTLYAHWIEGVEFSDSATYCVIDLSAGANAVSYPITYMAVPPDAGFNTYEYKTTKLVLRLINPGTFMMGGQYQVTLTKPFYCGLFEVTQKQYELVTGNNPSRYKGALRPVDDVSWNVFRGKSYMYNWPDSEDVDPSSFVGKLQLRTGLNIDLPTEAQWEYACRAGTTSKYNNGGNSASDLTLIGRYNGNESDGKGGYSVKHTAVGSYQPNSWGLYDMHGNVREFCLDWFDSAVCGGVDPVGPNIGSYKVSRGGSYYTSASDCTSDYRDCSDADGTYISEGFRLVRTGTIPYSIVTFDVNAGSIVATNVTRLVAPDTSVGTLPTPMREGYAFRGWWTAASGGTQISDSTVVSGDFTCYAHWKTVDPFPEICVAGDVLESLTGMADVRLGKNIKTVEQYNAFRSWAESNDIAYKTAKGSSRTWFSYAVGADGLVEKVFEKDDVTIDSPALASNGALSFEVNVDGLSLDSSATAQNLATVFDVQGASSLTDDLFSSENVDVALGVSSDGKLLVRAKPKAANGTFFIRVRMHPEDGGEQVGGDPVSAIVTVTFDANGGKGGTLRSVVVGESIGTLPIISRDNYAFDNWWTATDGGAQVGASTIVTGEVTYYAHWIADTYTVVYKPGANGSGTQQTATKTHDVPLLLEGVLFTRDGYTQTDWATSDGGAKVYDLGASYTANAAVTLYPFWTANTYTVTYKSGANGSGAQQTATKTGGVALTLKGALFTRDGYSQTGWAASDGGAKAYDLGASYTANAAITLYPFWTANTYTVTYKSGANGGGSQQTVSKTGGVALTLKGAIFTRDGYTQTGWATSDGGDKTYDLDVSYTANAAVTLYPFWTVNTYTVTYKPGANGSGSQQTATKTGGVALTLKGAIFTRDGYTQTSWATSDGGAMVYDLGASYTANAAITLYPFWTANKYTVTFDANGGTGGKTVTLDYGAVLSAPTVTRDGYMFTGWSPSVPATVPAGDVTYTAQWTANKYTVTFDANGGTGGKTVTLDYGTALSAPTVTRDGYTFTGWTPSVPATVPAGNVTYMAQWTANTYTVTYDPGANGSGAQQTDTKTGGIALKLRGCMFTREGYTQTGWTKWEGVYGSYKDYDLGASYTANAAVTLYPYWTANTYTVTYKPGANGIGSQQTATKKHDIGLVLADEMFTRDGYTQTGWSVSDGGALAYSLGVKYTTNAAITFYPYWTANTYTVTYKPGANGSGSQQTDKKTGGVALTLRDGIFTRDGYTQTGWATSDGGDKVYDLGGSYTANAAVTLYPYWTVGTYTVTYAPGVYGSGTQQTDTKTGGVALTLRGSIFTRYCYTQTGWATVDRGAKAYDLGASYTADEAITLYPYWTANTYTVTYQPGASGSGSMQTAIKTADKTLTLKGAIFTRSGYTQTGWSKSDGGAKAYDLNASYTANAAVTLYPFWTVNTYTVTYKPGVNGSGTQQTDTKTYGVALTLKSAIFTRSGYTQTGWTTSDGGAKAYDLGASYAANAAVTLYPFWTANTYTVTYKPGANGNGTQQTATKTHGVALALKSAIFTRDGYTQTGWATSDGGAKVYELGASYTANAAVTLYPYWTVNTYTVTYKPGANGSGTQQTATKTHGVALSLKDAIFTRDGYTQTGWATSDGGAKEYNLGASYTANATVTLYPFWTAKTYKVTYKPGANGSGAQQTATKTHGVALVLKGALFTRSGYTQAGWSTSDGGAKKYALGASYTANAAVTLYPFWIKEHSKVQLWNGGPYWATTNIGADDPSELGYYFWWGDTIGYKFENDEWVASDGSTSSFSFSSSNTPTYNKSVAALRSGGWITADSIFVSGHDAAYVHWDGNWRMPTKQELDDLNSKCNWSWTTKNGINGYVVRGKGDYASASIFLPVGGQGFGLWLSTSFGGYWSSVPSAGSNCAYNLDITEDYHDVDDSNRYIGLPIRPVQSFTE